MISKSKQAELRGRLFRHLDGLVTAPSAFELYEKGVLQFIQENGKVRSVRALRKIQG